MMPLNRKLRLPPRPTGVAQWLRQPMNQKVTIQFLVRAHARVWSSLFLSEVNSYMYTDCCLATLNFSTKESITLLAGWSSGGNWAVTIQ